MNDKIKLAAFIIIALIVLFAVYKIFQGIGIIDDKDDVGRANLMSNPAFVPITPAELNKHKARLLDSKTSGMIVAQIFGADKAVDDDAAAVAAIKFCKTQMQVKQIALLFSLTAKKDLANYLDFLNNEFMTQMDKYVKGLPKV